MYVYSRQGFLERARDKLVKHILDATFRQRPIFLPMSNPTHKAGGLYGGIRFSAATTVVPSTASDIQKNEATAQQIAPVIQPLAATAVATETIVEKKERAKENSAEATGGKSAAGIIARCPHLTMFY